MILLTWIDLIKLAPFDSTGGGLLDQPPLAFC
jgi:hypothetical protein